MSIFQRLRALVAEPNWLENPAQQIAFQDYVDAVMDAKRRVKRIEEQSSASSPNGLCAKLSMPCKRCGESR